MSNVKPAVFTPEYRIQFDNSSLIQAIAGKSLAHPPVWLMRQAGRYLPEYQEIRSHFPDFMSLCRSPDATTELALQPLRRFEFDAAIVFSDILTIADSLEMGLRFVPGEGPVLRNPITTPKQIERLPFDTCIEKLDYVFTAVRHLRAALGQRLPIIGFSGSPWTQACYMLSGYGEKNFTTAKKFAYTHPVVMTSLLERLAALTASYLYQQYLAGADVLFVIDTWGGLLADTHFSLYSGAMLQRIRDHLLEMQCPAPIMFFSKGLTVFRLSPLAKIPNLCIVGLDWCADLPAMHQHFPSLTFQGNLDPAILHAGPVTTQQHTRDLLESLVDHKRYIAGLGHGILPETPANSVHALVDTVRSQSSASR